MKQKLDMDRNPEQIEVVNLLQQRATVQSWLDRLEEQRGSVNERVLAKVRADYEHRLKETLDALSSHERAIQDELESATTRLVAAEEEHQQALDELEEGRLRNLIGEIDDVNWKAREAEFDQAVRGAAQREAEIRAETERLRDLLDQLDERIPAPKPSFTLDTETDSDADVAPDADDDGITVEEPALPPTISAAREDPRGRVISKAETDAFLDEIDRALASSPGAADSGSDDIDGTNLDGEEDTAPKPGLKCSECGYTNDLSAWFCGVCGADVG